jgi:DNA-binding response OmpR family regulator
VQEAENGAIGMSMALRNEADMVVCDVMMPELDGFQLLKALRADARWREVPFVFLTASADMDSHDLGIALGADDYLTKPFNLMDVMALIRRRLKQT